VKRTIKSCNLYLSRSTCKWLAEPPTPQSGAEQHSESEEQLLILLLKKTMSV